MSPRYSESIPDDRLYYMNTAGDTAYAPGGTISINRRIHTIPDTVVAVNMTVQNAIVNYNSQNPTAQNSPWQYYKLVNVQWKPINKEPGAQYTGPDSATYYQSNIVVETDYNLQRFSG